MATALASASQRNMSLFRSMTEDTQDSGLEEIPDDLLAELSPRQRSRGQKQQRMARWLSNGDVALLSGQVATPTANGVHQVVIEELILPTESEGPLRRVRCAVVGLVVLGLLRSFALNICAAPGWNTLPAHLVSCAADMLASIAVAPLIWPSTWALNYCMQRRCLGPLVTTVLVACVCDLGALMVFLRHGLSGDTGDVLRRPFTAGKSHVRDDPSVQGVLLSSPRLGVWACILISSVLIEAALCRSTWQLYRTLREAGAYPPGVQGLSTQVSPAELVCEAEDVALLAECKAEDCQAECLPICSAVRPAERIQHLDAALPEGIGYNMDEHKASNDLQRSVAVEQAQRSVARQSRESRRTSRDNPREISPVAYHRYPAEIGHFAMKPMMEEHEPDEDLAENPAHLWKDTVKHLSAIGMSPVNGRSKSAPPVL